LYFDSESEALEYMAEEFSDCGIEDIENIIDICKAYDSECPHVIKLIYNVQTESFDAEYDYEDVAEVYDKDVPVIVEEWVAEVEKQEGLN
jgi:hypothetical protein